MSERLDRPEDSDKALRWLIEGNRRFVAGEPRAEQDLAALRRDLEGAQHPFAIILGCSDSRVPAEIVFDQGLGDLFVIRVAGNIVGPTQIGSVEFAAAQFGAPLLVVLGHSHCGAIKATVAGLRSEPGLNSDHLSSITGRVAPTVKPLLERFPDDEPGLLAAATRANVVTSMEQLQAGSPILRELIDRGAFRIVGAEYRLDSGEVEFFV
jgi:carbonic anhydrase